MCLILSLYLIHHSQNRPRPPAQKKNLSKWLQLIHMVLSLHSLHICFNRLLSCYYSIPHLSCLFSQIFYCFIPSMSGCVWVPDLTDTHPKHQRNPQWLTKRENKKAAYKCGFVCNVLCLSRTFSFLTLSVSPLNQNSCIHVDVENPLTSLGVYPRKKHTHTHIHRTVI